MRRLVDCSDCNGSGLDWRDYSDCEYCYGRGQVESEWEEIPDDEYESSMSELDVEGWEEERANETATR